MYRILVFLCLTATALSQLELDGTCNFADKIQPSLDVPGLLGKWSEVKRVRNSVEVGQCSYWNIDIGESIASLEAAISTSSVYQRELVIRNGTIGVNLNNGVLSFSYSDGVSIDYVVQKTDYTNYAVLYGCNNNNNNKRSVYGHLLTRATGDSTVAITEFNSVLDANGDLKVATWEDVSHSDDACDTLELMESCDLGSKLQPNLNISGLLGTWSEAKRINNTIEVGHCSSWTVNLRESNTSIELDLVSSSVYEKKPVLQNGTITVNLTNGILHLTYSDGVAINYVVQKTDYDNYAVLYGCNDNNNTKSVYGQLLTRASSNSSIVTTEFNSALEANEDLKNATWVDVSHSDDACDTDGAVSIQLTSFFMLIVGLVVMKDL